MLCGIGVRFNFVCDEMLGGVSATIPLEIIGLRGTLTSRRTQHPAAQALRSRPTSDRPAHRAGASLGAILDDPHSAGRQHMVGLARMRGNSARKN